MSENESLEFAINILSGQFTNLFAALPIGKKKMFDQPTTAKTCF